MYNQSENPILTFCPCNLTLISLTLSCHFFLSHFPNFFQVSVEVKTAYSPSPSTVYSQLPPPQRQVTALKPLAPSSSVSTSYNIYPVSTSVQQPSTPISSFNLDSSFGSTASATTYSGNTNMRNSLFFLYIPFFKAVLFLAFRFFHCRT